MKIEVKAWAALIVTLVIGIIIGLLLNGAMHRRRSGEIERMRGPGGFVAEMERLIQPRDAAQGDRIRPYLEATDKRNRAIVDVARSSMRAELDSLRARIAPMLDQNQLDRFDDFARRGPPNERGGPPGVGGPPGLGGPPPPPPRR